MFKNIYTPNEDATETIYLKIAMEALSLRKVEAFFGPF